MKLTATEQIRVIMKRQGISVLELSQRLGLSRQAVNQALNKQRLDFATVEKYADAIGCDAEIIITPRGADADK